MLTLITKNNLGFTKPKCNCGLSMNLQKIKKTRKNKSRKNKSRKNKKQLNINYLFNRSNYYH